MNILLHCWEPCVSIKHKSWQQGRHTGYCTGCDATQHEGEARVCSPSHPVQYPVCRPSWNDLLLLYKVLHHRGKTVSKLITSKSFVFFYCKRQLAPYDGFREQITWLPSAKVPSAKVPSAKVCVEGCVQGCHAGVSGDVNETFSSPEGVQLIGPAQLDVLWWRECQWRDTHSSQFIRTWFVS